VANYNISKIVSAPGWLYKSPTGVASAGQYGTVLGFTEGGIVLRGNHRTRPIHAEEFGSEEVDSIDLGYSWKLYVSLKQWDDNTIQVAFPGDQTATGGTSSKQHFQYPGTGTTYYPGVKRSSLAAEFLFVPLDTTNYPIAYLAQGVGRIAPDSQMAFTQQRELMLDVIIDAYRNETISGSAYRGVYVGDITDVTLA